MAAGWRRHWPYYVTEAVGLAYFVSCASIVAVLLEHPISPVRQAIGPAVLRRVVQGVVMGLVIVSIAYSPWGKRSGAHINPAVTFAFWRLGSISLVDALWYVMAQVSGAIAAGQLMILVLGRFYTHPSVRYAMTKPMPQRLGETVAFGAEFVISFLMMLLLLWALQNKKVRNKTGWLIGGLIALYIVIESPYSGMSLNPARTLGTAVAADDYQGVWLYWVAPPAAMWLAAILFRYFAHRKNQMDVGLADYRPDALLPSYPTGK